MSYSLAMEIIPLIAFAGLCGIVVGYGAHAVGAKLRTAYATRNARLIMENAQREHDAMLREAKLLAKDEYIKLHAKFEDETRARRQELIEFEERISKREEGVDRRLEMVERKELLVEERLKTLELKKEELAKETSHLQGLIEDERRRIQEVSELTQDQARELLFERLKDDLRGEQGALIRRMQEQASLTAEEEARRIISMAVERYAADQVSDITTSSVALPNDEMKGRIIGKEGRNIRALEASTGVNFMIDDTPEVVVISGFDPLRREIARITLERLISDGRINPARIEEVVKKVESEIDETTRKAGEDAIFELGLSNVPPEIVKTLGRLKFRQSFSQNVLQHSIEVGHLMGNMAGELGLNVPLARRIGLFHDIGKALDHQIEGSHAMIGADLLKRNGEDHIVCNAVAAHHHEVEGQSVYAPLTAAADAMTASRPGARTETTEIYIQRLEKLENIANGFRGVTKSFAIQAGREVRVIVEPSRIDDNEAMQMARNISKQIEEELRYPGQIKVIVVRETRCVEYAR